MSFARGKYIIKQLTIDKGIRLSDSAEHKQKLNIFINFVSQEYLCIAHKNANSDNFILKASILAKRKVGTNNNNSKLNVASNFMT